MQYLTAGYFDVKQALLPSSQRSMLVTLLNVKLIATCNNSILRKLYQNHSFLWLFGLFSPRKILSNTMLADLLF